MREVRRFLSDPETCAYLGDRSSRLEYRLVTELSEREYAELLAAGWRRFGFAVFRPRCVACAECVPTRVRVNSFRPSRSQRRVLRRNADVEVVVGEPSVDVERLSLYARHHADRSRSRGWRPSGMDGESYAASFLMNVVRTLEFRYHLEGDLVALAYVGHAEDGLNSIYGFYDPRRSGRSLGIFDVLMEIEEARRLGKQFLYLGYHVAGCPSLEYKAVFRPQERLLDGEWRAIEEGS